MSIFGRNSIRVAYGSVPKESGTFTFYRNHRVELAKLGVDMRCVSVGNQQAKLWNGAFADDGCVLLAENEPDAKKQAMQFVDYCQQESIDIVIGINSLAILSALPHLPEQVRIVSRCANAFPEGYRVTVAGRERLARVIALTPRLRNDLVADYGVPNDMIALIPNGVALRRFPLRTEFNSSDPIRLGFLGRLEHKQKGVLHLPKIVDLLNRRGVQYHLRIAGTGVHESQLRKQLANEVKTGMVEFMGKVDPHDVPKFLSETDLFLFTSHFEGCPNALLEAMAAGCVSISWIISGITDFLLTHQQNGCLIPLNDHGQFVEQIMLMNQDRELMRNVSLAARHTAELRFSTTACAAEYARQFESVMQNAAPRFSTQTLVGVSSCPPHFPGDLTGFPVL